MDLNVIKATPKTGDEKLSFNNTSIKYNLLNFWQWSVSDILSNATRGRFAEFIVGTAIDLEISDLRDEWAAYDLKTKDGIKIEIKSAGYIQCWKQEAYSKISFSIKAAKYWDPETNMSTEEAQRHADVYVFCLLKHKDQKTIDPLKLEQWSFFVLPTYKLDSYTRSKSSITLNSLEKLADAVEYDKLKDKIREAYTEQNKQR